MTRTKKIAAAIVEAVKADGFNLGVNTKPAAGQAVFHTHLHIIPRFENDGFKHWPHKQMTQEEMQKVANDIRAQL
jgi:histidine triad (HIT) family protein